MIYKINKKWIGKQIMLMLLIFDFYLIKLFVIRGWRYVAFQVGDYIFDLLLWVNMAIIFFITWRQNNTKIETRDKFLLIRRTDLVDRKDYINYRTIRQVMVFEDKFQTMFGLATVVMERETNQTKEERNGINRLPRLKIGNLVWPKPSKNLDEEITIHGLSWESANRLKEDVDLKR